MTNSIRSFASLFILAGSLMLSACTSTTSTSNPPSASQLAAWDEYQQQVNWIKTADSQADFTVLREAFTRTAAYAPYAVRPVDSAINYYDQQQFSQCVKAAEQTIAGQFGHIQAHFLAMICQRELGNQSAADFHDSVVRGLLESIDQSGDGQSAATALTTYDMQELYTYLEFMGLTAVSQALVSDNERWYDVMTVTYEDEQREFKLYFDITRQFQRGFK